MDHTQASRLWNRLLADEIGSDPLLTIPGMYFPRHQAVNGPCRIAFTAAGRWTKNMPYYVSDLLQTPDWLELFAAICYGLFAIDCAAIFQGINIYEPMRKGTRIVVPRLDILHLDALAG